LKPLDDSDHAELKATRQYDKQPLTPLISIAAPLRRQQRLARVDGPDGNADYLWESLPLTAEGWTLHLLRRPQVAFEDSRNAASPLPAFG
jgi:two-component system C4-dicarboxylate transport sensor histidine kinase DctB